MINNITDKKVAVVTSISTNLGVEIVNKLLEESYVVFGFLRSSELHSDNIINLGMKENLYYVEGKLSSKDDWDNLHYVVKETCSKLNIIPSLKLLVNIPLPFSYKGGESISNKLKLVDSGYDLLENINRLLPLFFSNSASILNIYPNKPSTNHGINGFYELVELMEQTILKNIRKYSSRGINLTSIRFDLSLVDYILYSNKTVPVHTKTILNILNEVNSVIHKQLAPNN